MSGGAFPSLLPARLVFDCHSPQNSRRLVVEAENGGVFVVCFHVDDVISLRIFVQRVHFCRMDAAVPDGDQSQNIDGTGFAAQSAMPVWPSFSTPSRFSALGSMKVPRVWAE